MRYPVERGETKALGVQEGEYRKRRRYKRRDNLSLTTGKRMNDWIDDPDRPEGMNQAAGFFYRELKDVDKHLARNNTILWFLLTEYGMTDMRQMMISTSRMRGLVYKLMIQLKGYRDDDGKEYLGHAVTQEYVPAFKRDIANMRNRVEHVFFIIKKDLEETELYPYFREVGFDRLIDFGVKYPKDNKEQVGQLKSEVEEWNAEHRDEVDAHMSEMAERIQNRDKHREQVAEDKKAEKLAKRLAKKAQTAEVREIRENNRKHEIRERKMRREFERYYIK